MKSRESRLRVAVAVGTTAQSRQPERERKDPIGGIQSSEENRLD